MSKITQETLDNYSNELVSAKQEYQDICAKYNKKSEEYEQAKDYFSKLTEDSIFDNGNPKPSKEELDAADKRVDELDKELTELYKQKQQIKQKYDEANKKYNRAKNEFDKEAAKEREKADKEQKESKESTNNDNDNTEQLEATPESNENADETNEKQLTAEEKAAKEKAAAKIKSMLSKIADPKENIHKTVCIKAALLPSTGHAIKFCEYLQNNTILNDDGTCDWYIIDDNNNTKIDGKELKRIKKDWVLERAGYNTESSEDDNSVTKELEEAAKNAETKEQEIEAKKKLLDNKKQRKETLETNIDVLNKELNNVKKVLSKTQKELVSDPNNLKLKAQNEKAEETLNNINIKLNKYNSELNTINSDVKNLDTEIKQKQEQYKQEKESEEKQFKNKVKEVSWWKSNLKSWKQSDINEQSKKYGKKKTYVVPDEVSDKELIQMANFVTENREKFSELPYTELSKSKNKTIKNSVLEKVWLTKRSILSIKNELDPALLEETEAMTPQAASKCFSGSISNTFELAKNGIAIAQNPEVVSKMSALLASASAAALAKLTVRVNEELAKSTVMLMDITPITNIPLMASQEMIKSIWTPSDIINKINNDMNPDYLKSEMEKQAENKMKDAQNDLSVVSNQANQLVAEKLKGYKNATDLILKTLNQGPDWYIDNINNLEQKYEKEIISDIQKLIVPAIDAKYQLVDAMVSQVANNLVAPVNQALEAAQLLVLRKIVEVQRIAIMEAKALAAKATMKLLGLLGF